MSKPKCPNCQSTNSYVRIETRERVCRACGQIYANKPVKSKPVAPQSIVEASPEASNEPKAI